ncbi:MAG: hypothetical protein H7Z19_02665, partial [Chitinophagaceae bacterium]|nr:hypothetical protein [Rubrivivax sp.]
LSGVWAQQVREAFLDAYAQDAVAAGLWPDRAAFDTWQPLLALFEADIDARRHVTAPGLTPG